MSLYDLVYYWTLELVRYSKAVRLETAPTGGESGAGWTAEGFWSVGAGDFVEGVMQIRNSIDKSNLKINLIFNVNIDVFTEIDNKVGNGEFCSVCSKLPGRCRYLALV